MLLAIDCYGSLAISDQYFNNTFAALYALMNFTIINTILNTKSGQSRGALNYFPTPILANFHFVDGAPWNRCSRGK